MFLHYSVFPVRVHVREDWDSVSHLLIRLSAICGGVFSSVNFLSSLLTQLLPTAFCLILDKRISSSAARHGMSEKNPLIPESETWVLGPNFPFFSFQSFLVFYCQYSTVILILIISCVVGYAKYKLAISVSVMAWELLTYLLKQTSEPYAERWYLWYVSLKREYEIEIEQ